MSSKHITVESSPQTNRTKSITNRFQLNEKRCHRPTRSTRQEKSYKANSLTTDSHISNCRKQSNTLTQRKTCSTSNSRKKRYLSKRITYLQKEKQDRQPHYRSFTTGQRISSPSRRQTISVHLKTVLVKNHRRRQRAVSSLTPLQMNTFQCLCVPKKTNRFTKTRKSTISCSSTRVICQMISSLDLNSKCNGLKPVIYTKYCTNKRQVNTNQRYAMPCFNSASNCTSQIKRKKKIHLYE